MQFHLSRPLSSRPASGPLANRKSLPLGLLHCAWCTLPVDAWHSVEVATPRQERLCSVPTTQLRVSPAAVGFGDSVIVDPPGTWTSFPEAMCPLLVYCKFAALYNNILIPSGEFLLSGVRPGVMAGGKGRGALWSARQLHRAPCVSVGRRKLHESWWL